jgi:hypothetical protein
MILRKTVISNMSFIDLDNYLRGGSVVIKAVCY